MTCQAPPQQPGPCPKCGKLICGAKNRAGFAGHCSPGWGTDHPGVGRCKLHGGATPIKHGQRSKVPARYRSRRDERLSELMEEFEADPVPLDLRPELAAMRALARDFIERHAELTDALLAWYAGETNRRPVRIPDLAAATGLLEAISRVVARIENIRSENAISRPALLDLVNGMALVVKQHVQDEAVLEQIAEGWQALSVTVTRGG